MVREIAEEVAEAAGEKAEEIWDCGGVPTAQEFGYLIGYCVSVYLDKRHGYDAAECHESDSNVESEYDRYTDADAKRDVRD